MTMITENPFRSFWMAGFECTDQLNNRGDRVDFLHVTSHLELLREDYKRLSLFKIKVVREGVRWSQVEPKPYQYDFSILENMIRVGIEEGIQQVWDLCHFGFPDDLTPLHPHFCRRFEAFCTAFANFYLRFSSEMIVTPINEVGFMSWLGGMVGGTSPYCVNNGWSVKYAYMKAYIKGIEALKAVHPSVRIMTTEPLVNVTYNFSASQEQKDSAAFHHELQFQVLDMLSGRICPELGGREEYLDILGFNYYYNNQWTLDPHQILGWNDPVPNPHYRPLASLLDDVHKRYERPIVLSETSHPGEDRPVWLEHISLQIRKVLELGIPFWGICLYPIIDRPDWDNLDIWHQAGIWDRIQGGTEQQRMLHGPSADALLRQQELTQASVEKSENYLLYGDSINQPNYGDRNLVRAHQ